MVKLELNLPPHCQVKKRPGGYSDVYFMPHPKDRAEGWKPSIKLGRTDVNSIEEINKEAKRVHDEYLAHQGLIEKQDVPEKRVGTLPYVIIKYQESRFFTDIAERTRKDYRYYLGYILEWSERVGHPHIKYLTAKAIVQQLNKFEDRPVSQKRFKTVLSMLYKVAIREGLVETNIAATIDLFRRKQKKRELVIWEEEHVDAFLKAAEASGQPSVGRALIMALETAQRRGDVLKMQKPRDYDPATGRLKFKQSKTGKFVHIKATRRLKAVLDEIPTSQLPLFLNERTGKPWNGDVFNHKFREIADMAGLTNHIFMHTRHSAILYLNRAGVDVRGIASITGHSLKTVHKMLENHYLETRDQEVADQAIETLENYRSQTKKSDMSQTNRGEQNEETGCEYGAPRRIRTPDLLIRSEDKK